MPFRDHLQITTGALKNWAIAQMQDSLLVGLLWWIGLHLVPHIGPVLSLLGPVLATWIRWGSLEHSLYVLMLYAGIVLVDGFFLQPYLMKRTARVPIWASLLTPIVLGILIPFSVVLLSAPLLAILYAYKERQAKSVARL